MDEGLQCLRSHEELVFVGIHGGNRHKPGILGWRTGFRNHPQCYCEHRCPFSLFWLMVLVFLVFSHLPGPFSPKRTPMTARTPAPPPACVPEVWLDVESWRGQLSSEELRYCDDEPAGRCRTARKSLRRFWTNPSAQRCLFSQLFLGTVLLESQPAKKGCVFSHGHWASEGMGQIFSFRLESRLIGGPVPILCTVASCVKPLLGGFLR